MNNEKPNQQTSWGKVIIIGIIILFVIGYINEQKERRRVAEENRQNAEAFGAFVGGALRELGQ